MTGFASAEVLVGAYKLAWEIRSVNHRFLDLGIRLPDDFRVLEPKLRQLAGDSVKRGKVDCALKLTLIGADGAEAGLNAERLQALRRLEATVLAAMPEAERMSVHEILRWPGIVKDDAEERGHLHGPAIACFADAIDSLLAAREREGSRLAEMLFDRIAAIGDLMAIVDKQLDATAPRYRDKLLERLSKLDVEVNPERLEQELALIAQRTDVAEEADRLKAHLSEISDVLKQSEPVGRRLDFLIQELNREANTLASKVQDDELARRAVDIKVLIEQMREQVQNIE